MFTIGESRAISHADDTEQQEQQVAGNPRFSAETPLKNADQKLIASGEHDDNKKPRAKQREHRDRLAQRWQRRQHRGSDKILQLPCK